MAFPDAVEFQGVAYKWGVWVNRLPEQYENYMQGKIVGRTLITEVMVSQRNAIGFDWRLKLRMAVANGWDKKSL